MFRCSVCGSTRSKEEQVDQVFEIDGKHLLVEGAPGAVCAACGEETFSREATERVRRMVHGEAAPVRSASIDVFSFA